MKIPTESYTPPTEDFSKDCHTITSPNISLSSIQREFHTPFLRSSSKSTILHHTLPLKQSQCNSPPILSPKIFQSAIPFPKIFQAATVFPYSLPPERQTLANSQSRSITYGSFGHIITRCVWVEMAIIYTNLHHC